jgi:hypothetical protein
MSGWKNSFDFGVKRLLSWSPRVRKRTAGSISSLTSGWDPSCLEVYWDLAGRYDVSAWPSLSSEEEILRNLWILEGLDRLLSPELLVGDSLDVGSLNWWYLPALSSFAPGEWLGVELDAHQRYLPTLTTRKAQAGFLCSRIESARYHVGSVLEVQERFGFITWFLPYLSVETQQSGGLPDRFFSPDVLLEHVWQLLEPGGTLLVTNQGEGEVELQRALFSRQKISAEHMGEMKSVFYTCPRPRFAWLAKKPVG